MVDPSDVPEPPSMLLSHGGGDFAVPNAMSLWQETLGWQPDPAQQIRFWHLYQQVCEANRQFNLTRITEPSSFWEKHLWDSLSGIAPWLTPRQPISPWPASIPVRIDQNACRVIDIGTGAGFPGLPVAIVCPQWSVTLLDSTHKKVQFLRTLVQTLGLTNALPLVDRAERLSQYTPSTQLYDLALMRAVGSASLCIQYALPLLRSGGLAILYRGQWTIEEENDLKSFLRQWKGQLLAVWKFQTPLSQSQRCCLYIQKQPP